MREAKQRGNEGGRDLGFHDTCLALAGEMIDAKVQDGWRINEIERNSRSIEIEQNLIDDLLVWITCKIEEHIYFQRDELLSCLTCSKSGNVEGLTVIQIDLRSTRLSLPTELVVRSQSSV